MDSMVGRRFVCRWGSYPVEGELSGESYRDKRQYIFEYRELPSRC